MSAVDDMVAAFGEFDDAIERAQRQHHNYQEWRAEQWDPIEAARAAFYDAAERARSTPLAGTAKEGSNGQ